LAVPKLADTLCVACSWLIAAGYLALGLQASQGAWLAVVLSSTLLFAPLGLFGSLRSASVARAMWWLQVLIACVLLRGPAAGWLHGLGLMGLALGALVSAGHRGFVVDPANPAGSLAHPGTLAAIAATSGSGLWLLVACEQWGSDNTQQLQLLLVLGLSLGVTALPWFNARPVRSVYALIPNVAALLLLLGGRLRLDGACSAILSADSALRCTLLLAAALSAAKCVIPVGPRAAVALLIFVACALFTFRPPIVYAIEFERALSGETGHGSALVRVRGVIVPGSVVRGPDPCLTELRLRAVTGAEPTLWVRSEHCGRPALSDEVSASGDPRVVDVQGRIVQDGLGLHFEAEEIFALLTRAELSAAERGDFASPSP
jgi:hypothetical protein